MPFAECFRWDIRSTSEASEARAARAYGPIVPAHAVTLGVRSSFVDPMNARADIEVGRYRFIRNPAYADSPPFAAGRDLEVFGAIRFLRLLCEDDAAGLPDAELLDAVRSAIVDAMSVDTLGRLQESAFLRMRLHASLKSLAVELRTPAARALAEVTRLRAFVAFVDGESSPEPQPIAWAPSSETPSPPSRGVRPAPFRLDLGSTPTSRSPPRSISAAICIGCRRACSSPGR